VYPGVGGALLLPLFLLAVHVCSVCKGQGGEIDNLVPIILRARPVHWVSLRLIVPEPASSVIPKLARTRGLGDWITAFNGQKVTQKCAVNLVM